MQFRKGKECHTGGTQNSITDSRKKEITVVDHETQRYATMPFAGFRDEVRRVLPPSPPRQK